MTLFQHFIIGSIINVILWELWLKHYFYDEEEHRWWMEFLKRFF